MSPANLNGHSNLPRTFYKTLLLAYPKNSQPKRSFTSLSSLSTGLLSKELTSQARTRITPVTTRSQVPCPFLRSPPCNFLKSYPLWINSAAKRKQHPVAINDRPMKQQKPETDDQYSLDGDLSPRHGALDGVEFSEDDPQSMVKPIAMAETKEWQATIEKVVRNVVSIHFCQTCSFDTDQALSSEATGFVVDAEKGYILTNRHVVGSGPFWGYCIFDNHEEVS